MLIIMWIKCVCVYACVLVGGGAEVPVFDLNPKAFLCHIKSIQPFIIKFTR